MYAYVYDACMTIDIRRPDVRALIRAVPSGVVTAARLYEVYARQMAEQGRDPVSRKTLGQALEQCGQRAIIRQIDGKNVRCRVIHERHMVGEEFDTEPARI